MVKITRKSFITGEKTNNKSGVQRNESCTALTRKKYRALVTKTKISHPLIWRQRIYQV